MGRREINNSVLGYLYDLGINADINLCTRERIFEELNISKPELDDSVKFFESIGCLECTYINGLVFGTARITSFGITFAESQGIRS